MSIARTFEKRVAMPILMLHDKLYKATGGRIGHHVPGAPPMLLLHTVGAKTGLRRTNSLVYFRDGDSYLVVGSNGGDKRAPGWFHNLKADPNVEINLGRKRLAVTAEVLLPDHPDYTRLFEFTDSENSGRYAKYQQRTSRPIPVIRLTPKS
jgi:F420H(2)-dependent quinone reductase